eukprot:scaffold50983_cov21-Tisochrysis_lutea.AAC.1
MAGCSLLVGRADADSLEQQSTSGGCLLVFYVSRLASAWPHSTVEMGDANSVLWHLAFIEWLSGLYSLSRNSKDVRAG